MRILIFGDSIAYGAFDRRGGWAQRLKESLERETLPRSKFAISVYNLGASGNTTEDLLARFDSDTRKKSDPRDETMFIFAIGINDTQHAHGKTGGRVSLTAFRRNILSLIRLSRRYSQKIAFVGLTPVDESKTIPIRWDPDKSYNNRSIKAYDKAIRLVCKKNGILFVDIHKEMMALDYAELLCDGLHPNSKGHEKLYEMVNAAIRPMLPVRSERKKSAGARSYTSRLISLAKRDRLQALATRMRWAWLCWKQEFDSSNAEREEKPKPHIDVQKV